MVLAAGDTGFSARRTYDIEVWLPGQGALSRDLELLDLRRFPGPPHECPLPGEGCEADPVRPHPQRLRPRGRPHADRDPRELSGGRRQRDRPRGTAPLPARPRAADARGARRDHDRAAAHPGQQRRRHQRPGHQGARADRPGAQRRCLGGGARNQPERGGAFADADPAVAGAPPRRAPLLGRRHADRLRPDRAAADRRRTAGRPRAVGHQSRRQSRRGRHLFGHRRRRDGGHPVQGARDRA